MGGTERYGKVKSSGRVQLSQAADGRQSRKNLRGTRLARLMDSECDWPLPPGQVNDAKREGNQSGRGSVDSGDSVAPDGRAGRGSSRTRWFVVQRGGKCSARGRDRKAVGLGVQW